MIKSEIEQQYIDAIREKDAEINSLNGKVLKLERQLRETAQKGRAYDDLKAEIAKLTLHRDDLIRKANASTELSGLVIEIQNFLENKLAPIRFKKCVETLGSSDIVVGDLRDIVGVVQSWINEINKIVEKSAVKDIYIIDAE